MAQLVQVSQNSRLMNSRSLKDSGRSLAFADQGISGQALLADSRLVHLSAHQKCLGQSRSLASMRHEIDEAQANWPDRRPVFMEEVEKAYKHRRQRYNAFKTKLQSFSPSEEKQRENSATEPFTPPPPAAAKPQPLNPALRDFFLRLFSRDGA
jgi:hypothetical protein